MADRVWVDVAAAAHTFHLLPQRKKGRKAPGPAPADAEASTRGRNDRPALSSPRRPLGRTAASAHGCCLVPCALLRPQPDETSHRHLDQHMVAALELPVFQASARPPRVSTCSGREPSGLAVRSPTLPASGQQASSSSTMLPFRYSGVSATTMMASTTAARPRDDGAGMARSGDGRSLPRGVGPARKSPTTTSWRSWPRSG